MKALVWIGCAILGGFVGARLAPVSVLEGMFIMFISVGLPSWICKQIDADLEAKLANNVYTYSDIQNTVSQAVKDTCKDCTGNRQLLEKELEEYVKMGILKQRYVRTLLDHFAPLDSVQK